jgi:hypothetical protein
MCPGPLWPALDHNDSILSFWSGKRGHFRPGDIRPPRDIHDVPMHTALGLWSFRALA